MDAVELPLEDEGKFVGEIGWAEGFFQEGVDHGQRDERGVAIGCTRGRGWQTDELVLAVQDCSSGRFLVRNNTRFYEPGDRFIFHEFSIIARHAPFILRNACCTGQGIVEDE